MEHYPLKIAKKSSKISKRVFTNNSKLTSLVFVHGRKMRIFNVQEELKEAVGELKSLIKLNSSRISVQSAEPDRTRSQSHVSLKF
jgi:hypothetical protein